LIVIANSPSSEKFNGIFPKLWIASVCTGIEYLSANFTTSLIGWIVPTSLFA
ncbi:MAG: hypothetical protein RL673_468, partial [Actinomycetota bacterium]